MARTSKDDIDKFFDYGIEVSTKTIYIGSEVYDEYGGESGVDHELASKVIKGLHILDQVRKDVPITVILNNPGGDVIHGMAIYDALRACESPIHIKVFGQAMSMASIILQAADDPLDKRIMMPNSYLMIHYGYDAHASNHPKIIEKWVEWGKKYGKAMEELYLNRIREKHPSFTRAKLQKLLDFDTILSAQETVDLGLADEIAGDENDV